MQLLDVEFRFLSLASPDDRASAFVNFHHVFLRLCARKPKHSTEYEGNVAHEIHGIVVNHHIPRRAEVVFFLGL